MERAVAIWKKLHGSDHPLVATGLNNLSLVLGAMGALEEAIKVKREGLAIERRLLGTEHPQFASSLNNLAEFLREQVRPIICVLKLSRLTRKQPTN